MNDDFWAQQSDGDDDNIVIRPFSSDSAAHEMWNFTGNDEQQADFKDENILGGGGGQMTNDDMFRQRAATTNSVASAISNLSQNSTSAPMTLPFPFPGRPNLPHVDDFVAKSKLGYDHLRLMNNMEKKAAYLKGKINPPPSISQIPLSKNVTFPRGLLPEKISSQQSPFDSHTLEYYKAIDLRESVGSPGGSPGQTQQSSLSYRQVRLFIQYIQFFGEIDVRSSKYQGITYSDIETALRMHTRSTSPLQDGKDDTNDLLMAAFDDLLVKAGLTSTAWFQSHCMQVAGNEPKLTKELFNANIRRMCRKERLPIWTNHDMRQLRLHLSLDGQTEPTMNGVLRAFRRYHAMSEERSILEASNPVIAKIKRLMKARKIRIIDFFSYINADPARPISSHNLTIAIDIVLGTNRAVTLHSSVSRARAVTSNIEVSNQMSALSAVSMSSPTTPSRLMHLNSLSRDKGYQSTLLTSSMTGRISKKSGIDAVKTDPLPDEIATLIDARYQLSQCRLYDNGTIYTNKTGKKQIAKIMLAGKGTDAVLKDNTNVVPQGRGNQTTILGSSDKNIELPGFLANNLMTNNAAVSSGNPSPKATAPYVFGTTTNIPNVPNWAGFTLSNKFAAATKLRTTKLVEPFNIYDRKRLTYQQELAQFF